MNWLAVLGEMDRAVIMFAASWAAFDSSHARVAVLVSGAAVAAGYVLKVIAKGLGQPDPVPTLPEPPAGGKS